MRLLRYNGLIATVLVLIFLFLCASLVWIAQVCACIINKGFQNFFSSASPSEVFQLWLRSYQLASGIVYWQCPTTTSSARLDYYYHFIQLAVQLVLLVVIAVVVRQCLSTVAISLLHGIKDPGSTVRTVVLVVRYFTGQTKIVFGKEALRRYGRNFRKSEHSARWQMGNLQQVRHC